MRGQEYIFKEDNPKPIESHSARSRMALTLTHGKSKSSTKPHGEVSGISFERPN